MKLLYDSCAVLVFRGPPILCNEMIFIYLGSNMFGQLTLYLFKRHVPVEI